MNGLARLHGQAGRFLQAPLPAACRTEESSGFGFKLVAGVAKWLFLAQSGEGEIENLAVDRLQLADQDIDRAQAGWIPPFQSGCSCLYHRVRQSPFVHAWKGTCAPADAQAASGLGGRNAAPGIRGVPRR